MKHDKERLYLVVGDDNDSYFYKIKRDDEEEENAQVKVFNVVSKFLELEYKQKLWQEEDKL